MPTETKNGAEKRIPQRQGLGQRDNLEGLPHHHAGEKSAEKAKRDAEENSGGAVGEPTAAAMTHR